MTSLEDFSSALASWLGDSASVSIALTEHLWHSVEDLRLLVSQRGEIVARSDLSGDWSKLKNTLAEGINLADVIHEGDVVAWRDALLSTDHHSVELRLHTDIDAMPLMSVRATLRRCDREDDVLGFFVNLRDCTYTVTAQQQLLHQTTHDDLTQLPNRSHLLALMSERLQQLPEGAACAVLFIDLDRFKIINDSLGHSIGDVVLQQASARLRTCLGDDDILARFGGDEFLIGLGVAKSLAQAHEQAEFVAKKILREMAAGFVVESDTLHVTASIGIGVYPEDSATAEGLVQAADIAMYVVKSRGKNGFARHSEAMDKELFVQTRLEQELRGALADESLQVHYQPQISLVDGQVFGVEALARWRHPRLGEVEPAVFLELAQNGGIALAVDAYVQNRALADAAEWQRQGFNVAVSINISPAQIKQANFLDDFQQRLQRAEVAPSMVKAELVETALLDGADDILNKLQGVKALGVELAIDDFGTGYSSLSYLQQFPIDWLKIDKTFVAELKQSGNSVLVDAILAMGKGLGMKLIAEGVEHREQLDYLRNNGCNAVQGFLLAPALAKDELSTLLKQTDFSALIAPEIA